MCPKRGPRVPGTWGPGAKSLEGEKSAPGGVAPPGVSGAGVGLPKVRHPPGETAMGTESEHTPTVSSRQAPQDVPWAIDDLRRSGLSDETIRAAGIYVETDPKEVNRLLNRKDGERLGGAIVFPILDENDRPTGVPFQLKPEHRRVVGEREIRYETPLGRKVQLLFVPPGVRERLQDPNTPVVIVEGAMMSLAAAQRGNAAVAIAGVENWSMRDAADRRVLIDDLAKYAKGRRVFIVFDSDAITNGHVGQAERAFALALREAGADVRVVRLPPKPDGTKMG